MARLTSPRGSVVNVAEDKVAGLLAQGYASQDEKPKPAAKKASTSKPKK